MKHLLAIQTQLSAQKPTDAWGHYITIMAASLPFWEQAIVAMAELINASKKAQTYRTTARGAFTHMNNWYFEQAPYVKARRNEIDAAISFIRNAALRQNVATRPGAAAARNLASALRGAVYLAVRGYPPADYPRLMTSHFLQLAAAKALFPVDVGDLVSQFALAGEPPSENIEHFATALSRGAKHFGLEKEHAETYKSLNELWDNREAPKPWVLPDSAWEPQATSLLAEIHYKGVRDFHAG